MQVVLNINTKQSYKDELYKGQDRKKTHKRIANVDYVEIGHTINHTIKNVVN